MKWCFASVVTGNYFDYAKVMLHTLMRHGNITDGSIPYFIRHDDKLDRGMREEMRKIYPAMQFQLLNIPKMLQHDKGNATFWSIELFTITGWDRMIILDADLLVLGDMSELIKVPIQKVGMVHELNRNCYNAGMMIVRGDQLGDGAYNRLLNISVPRGAFGHDQWVYNDYFKNAIEPIDQKYNTLLSEVPEVRTDMRVLHYIYKPDMGSVCLKKEFKDLWYYYSRQEARVTA